MAEQIAVARREGAAFGDEVRQTLELFAPDRRQNVGHPVVITQNRVVFEDNPARSVACAVGDTHPVLSPEPEPAIPLGIRRCEHPAVAGGDHLPWVEGKAGDVTTGAPDGLPAVF